MRNSIEFIRNGQVVRIDDVDPTDTLLDYLRLKDGSCGTKEGCGEGDCGACTVVLGSHDGKKINYRPINSCITLLGMIDGQELVTVDDLSIAENALHPVQAAMVDNHGSQCGFCTPGFVMSLFALYHGDGKPSRQMVLDQIAGNLCRCTGYRPIVDAGLEACSGQANDQFTAQMSDKNTLLSGLSAEDLLIGNEGRFFAAPRSLNALAKLYTEHPDATLVAGATDVGLWITKKLADLPKIIHLGQVAELNNITENNQVITIGAGVSYDDAANILSSIDPDITEVMRRIGSTQVRASATIGGNVANGSPIGDMPPMLIALGASLTLQKGDDSRILALEDFFISYGKQDRQQGEFLKDITIPRLRDNEHFRSYKITKRFDQDITSTLGAFLISVDRGIISGVRIAYGGMAEIPKRANSAEKLLIGVALDDIYAIDVAIKSLENDFSPLTDMRASDHYRMTVAQNLLRKALIEIANPATATRIINNRGQDHVA